MLSITKKLLPIASLGLGLSLLVGCGDDGDDPAAVQTAPNGDVFNEADVEFATEMIPHHAEALEMVDQTVGRDLSPDVQALAAQIREAQAPEVEEMTDWLTAWEEPVPETSLDHANAEGHGHDEGGADEMDELEAASDAEFEPLFLEMMIEHHQGAVEMAETEQSDGEYADAIALAEAIEKSQTSEIETMEQLLGS
ncbi:MAG: DUF305 domain-containing protein [Actinomycetota bacterium]|nr:DUF305 domain-containing protein [Actinomycetota bacterium]